MAANRRVKLPSGVRIMGDSYQVRYIGPDGKRYSKSFSHLEDAKYWHAFERRMMDQGEWTPPAVRERKQSAAALTLSEWAEQRIHAWSTRSRSPIVGSTVEDYKRAFRLRIENVLGEVPVSLLTPAKVRSWHEGLPDTPTINGKSYDLLKHLLNDAINDEADRHQPVSDRRSGEAVGQGSSRGPECARAPYR